MRLQPFTFIRGPFTFIRAVIFGLVLGVCAPAAAQTETYTADASVKAASGASAAAQLTVLIQHLASPAERDELIGAVKSGGNTAAQAVLAKRSDAGMLQLGTQIAKIKHAYSRSMGAGRLITLVTSEPIAFIGSNQPNAPKPVGNEVGLVILQVSGSGAAGTGEVVPAATVRVDDQGAIVTKDYSGETVKLTNVKKK